jgi:hypothetical protein
MKMGEKQPQILPSASHPIKQKSLAGDPVKNGYGQDDTVVVFETDSLAWISRTDRA